MVGIEAEEKVEQCQQTRKRRRLTWDVAPSAEQPEVQVLFPLVIFSISKNQVQGFFLWEIETRKCEIFRIMFSSFFFPNIYIFSLLGLWKLFSFSFFPPVWIQAEEGENGRKRWALVRHVSPPRRDDDPEGHYVFSIGENLTPRCEFLFCFFFGRSSLI